MATIIAYEQQYKEDIITMILQIQQEEFGVNITRKDQPDLDEIDRFYQTGDGNFWIAIENDEVIGSIGLKDIGNGDLVLRKMFVKKEKRGKELGISKALLNKAVKWATSKRKRAIYLGTTDKFIAAQRFYEKHGFKRVKKEELPKNFPIMTVDSVFYMYPT